MSDLEFWFDYTCPFAYVGFTQAARLAERIGARLVYQPMLLGGVFRANDTPQKLFATLSPAKATHNGLDMQRWAEAFGVPLTMPAAHPMRSVEALRATLVTGCDPRVISGFFDAYWRDSRPPSDESTMRDVLGAAGHDASAVLEAIARPEVKDELRARTERAVALGIFGAPSWVRDGGPLLWGQDRMHFVAGGADLDFMLPRLVKEKSMPHTLDVYWDFSSPFAYLGATQAKGLAERTGAKLSWRPMLLGGLFKSIGQVMVPLSTWSAAKQRYYMDDLDRWADYWKVPFKMPSTFPMNSLKAMRTYLAMPDDKKDAFREATFRAYWAEDKDISSDAVLTGLIGDGAADVLARTQDPTVKQSLVAATERAAEIGVFGAPTWVVDGKDLYWGQDRLVLVERALLA